MTQTLACPFCGAMMEAPLHFCQECGRAVSAEDFARSGLKFNKQDSSGASASSSRRFALAKRDHSGVRQLRNIMWTTSIVLFLVIGYYSIMKFVLHEHMPGNLDVKLEQAAQGQPVDWTDWTVPVKKAPAAQTQQATKGSQPDSP